MKKTTKEEVKRAKLVKETKVPKRAKAVKTPKMMKRATAPKTPMDYKRATHTPEDRLALRLLVRAREDFQAMRKRMDNRIGRKADGKDQDIVERVFRTEDLAGFAEVADEARKQESAIEKRMKAVLKRFPIYENWLKGVKGVGPIAAGIIISSFDIEKATTVSKMWQYSGLNPSTVRGKKRKDKPDGSFDVIVTDTMIRGDKLTAGFIAPFNKNLRTALCGVLADGFIKAQAPYALEFYYPYKERLANSDKTTQEIRKAGAKAEDIAWKDAKLAHRDRAAKRYMIKMFLLDLYRAWREIEGLEVREPYQDQYLGHKHRRVA
jgi:hypothetical protein